MAVRKQRKFMRGVSVEAFGVKYERLADACRANGVPLKAVYNRVVRYGGRGVSLDEIIVAVREWTRVRGSRNGSAKKLVYDGVEYPSIKDACEAAGVPYRAVMGYCNHCGNHTAETISEYLDIRRNGGKIIVDNNRIVRVNGKDVRLVDACRNIGISQATFYRRVKLGMSVEDALTTPPGYSYEIRKRRWMWRGKLVTIGDAAKIAECSYTAMQNRMKLVDRGEMSIEAALRKYEKTERGGHRMIKDIVARKQAKDIKEESVRSFELGGNRDLVAHRIRRGWSREDAMSIPAKREKGDYRVHYNREKIRRELATMGIAI